jgi:phosphoribosylformimino-5-aminoimidazole carboxamide ribotide isomerase
VSAAAGGGTPGASVAYEVCHDCQPSPIWKVGRFKADAMFDVYPAIDLRHGNVVRLQEGDPLRQTVFDADPVAVANRWAVQGTRWLHVVNLDGAFGESNSMQELLPALCRVGPRVQCGGGIRSLADVEAALNAGAARVILGTVAVERPEVVREAMARFGAEAIAVGIDAREGRVRIRGWQAGGGLTAIDLGRQMKAMGVETVIHTDIAQDGLLSGVNARASAELAQVAGLRVIASGGVAGLGDIRRVRGAGLAGVIIGRALYEGKISLKEALADDSDRGL